MNFINLTENQIKNKIKKGKITICVIGLGRIGLPTACVFANAGAQVLGVDINKQTVNNITNGICPYQDEPGLTKLLKKVTANGKLKANTDTKTSVAKADTIILCVPTPVNKNKTPITNVILTATKEIANSLKKGTLVIIESTVSPGLVENEIIPTLEKHSKMKAGKDFGVASCPERASPGESLKNMKSVPRVIGGINPKITQAAATLYQQSLNVNVIQVSNPKTANAVKLTENIFRDVNIALMNEFAILYEKLEIDTYEVIKTCASKWNFVPHYPGPGVGGPCLPANAYYIIDEGIKVGYIPHLIRMAREINDRMPDHVITLITEALNTIGKVVSKSKIAILGVAYKPDIHDLQLTPFKRIHETLKTMGANITIYDPLFKGEKVFETKVTQTLDEAIKKADCIIMGTAHTELKKIDLTKTYNLTHKPTALVDTQNIIEPKKAKQIGFAYIGVGRRLD
jgi:nucleotide sugar dehydrogenase